MSEHRKAFTGRSRELSTKRSVKIADWVSQALITVGGIGTIVAVATVALFLVAVVLPLFEGAEIDDVPADEGGRVVRGADAAPAMVVAADEYLTTGWTVDARGQLTVFRCDTGETLETRMLFEDRAPTAWSARARDGVVVAGFEDGTVRVVDLEFRTEFLRDAELPDRMLEMAPGDVTEYRGAMVERTVEGQFRRQEFLVTVTDAALDLGDGAVVALDHAGAIAELQATALLATDDGTLGLVAFSGTEEEDMFTGETAVRLMGPQPLELPADLGGPPAHLATAFGGTNRYVAWETGTIARFARGQAAPAELVDASGSPITCLEMLIGERTLIIGRADGSVEGWFPARVEEGGGDDGFALQRARTMASAIESPVRTIGNATRSRVFISGHDDGTLAAYYMVSGERIAEVRLPDPRPVAAVAVSPKEDAILAATSDRIVRYAFEPMYPEASFRTLFMPLWYEGYPESDFVWQSSAATDAAEPKLSLVPLVFGTLKATFYSMLFGAPIALMAAIYTSEFLNPKIKAWVKPAIEMMASLPSVVLGFLAALVFAPVIEELIPGTLALFMTVPFVLVLGAFLWQLLPSGLAIRFSHLRIAFVGLVLPIGIAMAVLLGPVLERLLFAGSLRLWLNGLQNPDMEGPGAAGALGGWVVLLIPLCAIAVGWIISRHLSPRLFATRTTDRREAASRDLIKFAIGTAATIAAAFGLGALLSTLGFDVRGRIPGIGSFADTYDQRNSLVVGFAMGFAIIPIIYTIADDALSTVPEHLRGASLGAGATPWQTAVRIVIPTAMSGLFSACMIGLGRAVGETMIVLMALGNTPVMDINVFEGARTLSANLAVELPEAAQGSGHYRILFLSALVLFAMTFVLNTVAETIRLRFRRRAYQL